MPDHRAPHEIIADGVAAFSDRTDTDVLSSLAALPALVDENHPSWDSDAYWRDVASSPSSGGQLRIDMTEAPRDRWATGVAYEAYMGRWSRSLARAFLEWLNPRPSGHWLEVGCGTGSLICDLCQPASVVACDPSEPFIDHARSNFSDVRTSYVITAADALPSRDGGFDAVVSGLVLNFIPEPGQALAAMRERIRPGGTVAAYVWDYAGGVEFLQYFWEEAVL